MVMNVLLIVSLVGVMVHLFVESKTLYRWKEGHEIFGLTGVLIPLPLKLTCGTIGLMYVGIITYALTTQNDFGRILIFGAQGAIFLNALIHFLLKFVWKNNMPGFPTALISFLPSIGIIFLAYKTWWFSDFLLLQIFLGGMIIDALLPILLGKIYFVFLNKSQSPNNSDWDSF